MNKVFATAGEAIHDIGDGAILHVGGFGLCGIPENLIAALRDRGVQGLTAISNNAGVDDFGLGLLLQTRQIRKMISTYVGENKTFEKQFLDGELEVELVPQGTFSERIRAAGAGIPAFYTPTGVGTVVADGKEVRERLRARPSTSWSARSTPTSRWSRRGRETAFGQPPIFRRTARNFNPMMATAAPVTIAEVEELVDVGELDPDAIHTPGIFVQRVVEGAELREAHRAAHRSRES